MDWYTNSQQESSRPVQYESIQIWDPICSQPQQDKRWVEQNHPASKSQQKPTEVISLKGEITDYNLFKYKSVFCLNFSYSKVLVMFQ